MESQKYGFKAGDLVEFSESLGQDRTLGAKNGKIIKINIALGGGLSAIISIEQKGKFFKRKFDFNEIRHKSG